MRTERRTTARGVAGAIRPFAGTFALAAAAVLTVPTTASAEEAGPPSAAELTRASEAVLRADVAGTAWHIDRQEQALVVMVDSTVSDGEVDRIRQAVGDGLDMRIEHTPGEFTPYVNGGDAILTDGMRCSLGFNVRSGGNYYFLTAGHCTSQDPDWQTRSGEYLGPTRDSSFPGNDYGLVAYEGSVPHPGTVGGTDITRAGEASVGQEVRRRGSTTGVHSGTVTGLDVSVNYGNGQVVHGMIRADVCAEAGDSGGPLYSGSTALGLTSGGSGDCTSGGTTFFQPVVEALEDYGVNVY